MSHDTRISAGRNKPPLLTPVGAANAAVHVQLDMVVDDLSWNVGTHSPERPIDSGRLELLHRATLDADGVVMTMVNTSRAVHVGSIHHRNLADHSRLEKEFDGPIYRRPAHRGQLFTDRLSCKAFIRLLQELGYRFPGSSGPIASVLQRRHQVWCVVFQVLL